VQFSALAVTFPDISICNRNLHHDAVHVSSNANLHSNVWVSSSLFQFIVPHSVLFLILLSFVFGLPSIYRFLSSICCVFDQFDSSLQSIHSFSGFFSEYCLFPRKYLWLFHLFHFCRISNFLIVIRNKCSVEYVFSHHQWIVCVCFYVLISKNFIFYFSIVLCSLPCERVHDRNIKCS